jgi:hypothetical protein
MNWPRQGKAKGPGIFVFGVEKDLLVSLAKFTSFEPEKKCIIY